MDKQEQLNAIITEHMKNLPPEVKDVIKSFSWLETMQSLAAAYKLNIDQQGILATEVTMSILGIIHPDDFSHELRNNLHLSTEQTENLIVDLNEKIFRPIRAKLIGVYNKNQEKKAKFIAGEEDEDDIEVDDEVASDKIPLAEELANAVKIKEDLVLPNVGVPLSSITDNSYKGAPLPKMIEPRVISPQNTVQSIPTPAVTPTTTEAQKVAQTENMVTSELRKDVISVDMVNKKLGGMFTVPTTETDHSLNKSSGGAIDNTTAKSSTPDPYREAI